MSIAGVAKLFLYKGQRVSVSGSAGRELNPALPPLCAVPRLLSGGRKCSLMGPSSFQLHVQACMLVAWNRPRWEYLHPGNCQRL